MEIVARITYYLSQLVAAIGLYFFAANVGSWRIQTRKSEAAQAKKHLVAVAAHLVTFLVGVACLVVILTVLGIQNYFSLFGFVPVAVLAGCVMFAKEDNEKLHAFHRSKKVLVVQAVLAVLVLVATVVVGV